MTRSHLQMARHANRNATVDIDNRHFNGNAVVILDSGQTQAHAIAERLLSSRAKPGPKPRPPVTIRKFSWAKPT